MRTSYRLNGYGELIESIARLHSPKRIVEFGVLDGYSLTHLMRGAPKAHIEAYDIFDRYEFNHADRKGLQEVFGDVIRYGDFRAKHIDFGLASIDLLHIDISNTGDVYEQVFRDYMPRVSPGGVVLLEGGSRARDNLAWMIKFGKRPIRPVLEECPYEYFTFEPFPSLTIVYNNI